MDSWCIHTLTSNSSDNSESTLTLVFAPSYRLITDLTKTSGILLFLIAHSNIYGSVNKSSLNTYTVDGRTHIILLGMWLLLSTSPLIVCIIFFQSDLPSSTVINQILFDQALVLMPSILKSSVSLKHCSHPFTMHVHTKQTYLCYKRTRIFYKQNIYITQIPPYLCLLPVIM